MVAGALHPERPPFTGEAFHPSLVAQLERLGLDPVAPPAADGWAALLHEVSRWYSLPGGDRRQAGKVTDSFLERLAARVGDSDLSRLTVPGTDIPNGQALLEALQVALLPSNGHGEVAVLLVGLEGLARIGQRLGERGAKEVLADAADRVRSAVRSIDLVAFNDDDQFGVLLGGMASEQPIKAISHRLERAFSEPLVAAGHYVYFTAAVGAALARPGSSATDAIRRGRVSLDWQRSTRSHPSAGNHVKRVALSA